MINVTTQSITVIGTKNLKVYQLGNLIEYYLEHEPDVINEVTDLLSEHPDLSFNDCFYHRFIKGV